VQEKKMSIYPKSDPAPAPAFVITEAEKKALKAGLVTAFEENVGCQQDRALRAVELTKFDATRTWEIKRHLWMIFDFEKEVLAEVAAVREALEAAFADGCEDPAILADAIECEAVDKGIFADRFVRVKRGETVLDPVVPIKKVVEVPIEPIEPIEPLKEGEGEIVEP
jgi:hypothetical protein